MALVTSAFYYPSALLITFLRVDIDYFSDTTYNVIVSLSLAFLSFSYFSYLSTFTICSNLLPIYFCSSDTLLLNCSYLCKLQAITYFNLLFYSSLLSSTAFSPSLICYIYYNLHCFCFTILSCSLMTALYYANLAYVYFKNCPYLCVVFSLVYLYCLTLSPNSLMHDINPLIYALLYFTQLSAPLSYYSQLLLVNY